MIRIDLFNQLVNELSYLQTNDEFLISDLFKGYEWKKIAKADRLWLGRKFLNRVKNNEIKNIEVMEKTSSNKQVYKKTSNN